MAPTEQHLELMTAGEAFALAQLDDLADTALDEPSGLPGWTRKHVATHLARNADALVNLLTWARSGVETPGYASSARRDADIEAGATRPAGEVRDDLVAASGRLLAAVADLPDTAWDTPVRLRDRELTAAGVPWLRVRESWIHGVDLRSSATFAELPASVLEALLDDVTAGLSRRPDCPAIRLLTSDPARMWTVTGEGGPPVEVEGTAAGLLAWLIGRAPEHDLTTVAGAPVPELPAWL